MPAARSSTLGALQLAKRSRGACGGNAAIRTVALQWTQGEIAPDRMWPDHTCPWPGFAGRKGLSPFLPNA